LTEPCIPEKHDKRPQDPHKFKICKCGHYWHNHGLGLFGLFWTQCEECMCSKYRQLGKFTYTEVQNLKHCDENE
jgi:hypothetical protein